MPPAVAPVPEALCSLNPRDLLHPLVTTLGTSPLSGPLTLDGPIRANRFADLGESIRRFARIA